MAGPKPATPFSRKPRAVARGSAARTERRQGCTGIGLQAPAGRRCSPRKAKRLENVWAWGRSARAATQLHHASHAMNISGTTRPESQSRRPPIRTRSGPAVSDHRPPPAHAPRPAVCREAHRADDPEDSKQEECKGRAKPATVPLGDTAKMSPNAPIGRSNLARQPSWTTAVATTPSSCSNDRVSSPRSKANARPNPCLQGQFRGKPALEARVSMETCETCMESQDAPGYGNPGPHPPAGGRNSGRAKPCDGGDGHLGGSKLGVGTRLLGQTRRGGLS